MLSKKLLQIVPSATFAMKAKAQELIRQGKKIVSLTIGECDLPMPKHVSSAALAAIQAGHHNYTDSGGLYELKQAIINKFKRDNNIDYTVNQVMAATGGKQALYNIFQAILNPGDEVILPEPFWVSYIEQIHLADGVPVVINTIPNNFKLTAELVKQAITPKTKAVVLNSPSNPTGVIVDDQELKKIAELAVKHNFYVISDEVYEFLYFTEKKPLSIASFGKEIFDLTLTVNAISKSFSMTGWRLGFVGGSAEIIKLMDNLQSQSTSNPNIIAQYAAIAALNGDLKCVYEMRDVFKVRRDFIKSKLATIPNIEVAPMEGAFYAFINVGKYFNNQIKSSFDFCLKLLGEVGLGLTPGGAFGPSCDQYVRMSYAADIDVLEEGILRLKKFLKN